jgi:hypothetical protein
MGEIAGAQDRTKSTPASLISVSAWLPIRSIRWRNVGLDGHALIANGFVEKVLFLTKDFNRIVIGFANTHKSNHRSKNVAMRNFRVYTVDAVDRFET